MCVFSNSLFFYNFVWNYGDLLVTSRFSLYFSLFESIQGQLQIWTEHSHNESKYIDSSWIYGYLYSKTKMGVAGLIFKPHSPNFENQYNFWMCSNDAEIIFWFLYWFQMLKDQCSVLVPVSRQIQMNPRISIFKTFMV